MNEEFRRQMSDVGAKLRDTLQIAVPLHLAELSQCRKETLIQRAQKTSEIIAGHGDALMFTTNSPRRRKCDPIGVPRWYGTAEVFNALAEGIACLLLVTGREVELFGVKFKPLEK